MSEERKFMRVTSLFKTKKGGRVGSLQGEYLKKFVDEVVAPAYKNGKAITFFVKVWKEGENPVISAGVTDPYEKKAKEEDPFAGPPSDGGSEEVPF